MLESIMSLTEAEIFQFRCWQVDFFPKGMMMYYY